MIVMMEYAPGGSLADRMVKPYTYDKAMEIVTEVAEGLDFAHKNNVIHGNLRPSNILFTKEDKIKLSDFGLPPHYNMAEKNWYIPPERRITKQADIYALGVILHQMMFIKNPVYDRSGKLFLGNLQKTIPAPLYEIMNKFLSIRTTQRYRGIEEFLSDWDDFSQSISHTHAPLEQQQAQEKHQSEGGLMKRLLHTFNILKKK